MTIPHPQWKCHQEKSITPQHRSSSGAERLCLAHTCTMDSKHLQLTLKAEMLLEMLLAAATWSLQYQLWGEAVPRQGVCIAADLVSFWDFFINLPYLQNPWEARKACGWQSSLLRQLSLGTEMLLPFKRLTTGYQQPRNRVEGRVQSCYPVERQLHYCWVNCSIYYLLTCRTFSHQMSLIMLGWVKSCGLWPKGR